MKSGHVCEPDLDMNPNGRLTLTSCVLEPESGSRFHGSGCQEVSERLCNGSDQTGPVIFCNKSESVPDGVIAVTSEDDSRSLASGAVEVEDEDDLTPEIRHAYRIFRSFLSEKHKATTAPFWHPISSGSEIDLVTDSEMCFKKMDDKFVNREYESITAFVADFRLMLENCYRFHGVHHWMSKQAQKLEMILEQKLTLLSRTLREKTTLAVTSKGRFGTEDEKVPAGTSSRRRSVPRNLAAITVGGTESIMVQALRLEEIQRAKDEKRQRELEKKEAEEVSVKEMEDWESWLFSLSEPWSVRTIWELPAIGHFLCLAQTALNLPEIVYYELERCLLMPRCSSFLSKVMTSLLCPPHKRSTLHRRPSLPYGKWEAELCRVVRGWYQAVGRTKDQVARAEQLGLCHRFFWTLGETNPLEETAFHLLPFNRRVWLVKGLCDHVYQTQKDVQDAVLGQPIHECRESILGYDSQENAYIHFPHFCGADLRIYRQSPCLAVEFPPPPFHVKRSEETPSSGVSLVKDETNYVSAVKLESDSSEMCGEDDFGRKCSFIKYKEDHEETGMDVGDLKEEADIEPCFKVGDSCYKGKSPVLNSHTHKSSRRDDEKSLCDECSETSSSHLCSHCRTICKDLVQTEIQRRRQERSKKVADMMCTKRKKRKKKNEIGMRKTNKLNFKNLQQQRIDNIRKKKRKLRRKFHVKIGAVKRKTGSLLPVEPTFQLVCSSLDDLRGLISRTEDQLDELNSTKKRSGRWQQKRSTVKELHITLIRLLNELLPWEQKLVKAFQKNRARLKKECDDFKKHPEYENFIREPMQMLDTGEDFNTDMTQELQDEVKALRTSTEDYDGTEHVHQFESHKSSFPDEIIKSGPFTRSSKRRHNNAVHEEQITLKRDKIEPEIPNIQTTQTSERSSCSSESVRIIPSSYKPIQALLAKSVGNKVTLINHPRSTVVSHTQMKDKTSSSATHQPVQSCSQTKPVSTVTLTSENTGPVVYKTAGGLGLLKKGTYPISNQKPDEKLMQQVFILPSNLLIQSTEMKPPQQSEITSVPVSNTTNTPGFVLPPEHNVLKDRSDVRTTSAAAVLPPSRTFPTTTGSSSVPKKTDAKVATTKPDVKQELRTVCIRDSQSILVTTRGGNTGVVKVQTSEASGTVTPSPVFAISSQLQAFLVSKSNTSTTPAVHDIIRSSSHPLTNPVNSSTAVTGIVSVDNKASEINQTPVKQTASEQLQKVFLVSPSTSINTTTSASAAPGSRLVFINHTPVSDNSTRVVPKTSEASVSFTSPKMIPSRQMTLGCATTNVQSVVLPGSSPRMCDASTVIAKINVSSVRSSESVNSERPPKANTSVEGRTFSTLGTGHMASSELLSVVKHNPAVSTTSVLDALKSKAGVDISSAFSGGIMSNHTTSPLHRVTARKPQMMSSPSTSVTSELSLNSTTQSQAPPGVMISGMRPPNSIQEKIVINTSAPLAPGTQLLINNARFVVPPRGLGAGSHVLLISGASGMNVVAPQQTLVRFPSPGTATTVHRKITSGPSSALSHVTQPLHAGLSSHQPGLTDILNFQRSKALVVTESSLSRGRLINTRAPLLSLVPAVRTVISPNAPVVTRAPVMMQKPLNVGSDVITPPLNNTLSQPIRAVGNPVVLHQQPQTQSKSVVEITSRSSTNSTSKLLLSPDGAVLNLVQSSTSANVQIPTQPMRQTHHSEDFYH